MVRGGDFGKRFVEAAIAKGGGGQHTPKSPVKSCPPKSRKWQLTPGCLVVVTGTGILLMSCLICGFLGWVIGPSEDSGPSSSPSPSGNSSSRSTEDLKINAWIAAQQFVEQRLKAPSTAEYGSLWDGTYQNPDDCVTNLGGGSYRVVGWVDAQNSFGAKIRSHFVVSLSTTNGGKTWSLTDIQIIER
jgi:hypothetical protein